MAKEIEKEIEKVAEKMAKSIAGGKQALFDTIMTLGPEGLKKAMPLLSEDQQKMLNDALEEMKKAAHSPVATDDAKKLTPEHTTTKNAKLRTESLSGSDDEDEKLMEDKNRDIKHQGGPKDKPEGWEGQIIKAKEPAHKGPHGGTIIGHTKDGKPIYEHAGHEAHKEFSPNDHRDAAQVHQILADKHHGAKMASPYASVSGLQSMAGSKKKFKAAEKQHSKDSLEHDIHRESAAHHRRMADAKEGLNIGDLTPDDHQAQAQRHLDRADKLMSLRKMCKGYGSKLMKDMSPGGAGGYGLALSMEKSVLQKEHEHFQKEYENFMTKASSKKLAKKQGVPEGVDPEKWERGVKEVKKKPGIDNPYAVVNAAMAKGKEMEGKEVAQMKEKEKEELSPEQKLEKKKMKKAKKMAKNLHKIVKMAKSLGMSREDVKKAIENANGNLKIVKSEMKSKILKEEDQVKIKTQDESQISAPKPDQSKGNLEIKSEATADEAEKKLPKVEKSIKWAPKSSIAAHSGGRNTHWDVDAFIESNDKEVKETIAKGGYLGEKQASEELNKAQDPAKKLGINEMLEKGYDRYSADEIRRLEGIKNHKPDAGAIRKSNYDVAIAESMGMTKEQYEKIFGSNE